MPFRAIQRPWDGLVLPEGWAQVLLPGSGVSGSPERLERCERGARERCHCGLVHKTRKGAALCDGVAVDSAYNFHHFLATRSCPTVPPHSLGFMDKLCPHCHAQFFAAETLNCCQRGAVCVPVPEVPARLQCVISSPAVLKHIRVYNMAMSMASTGHQNLSPDWGMFVLGGKTYHRMSARFDSNGVPPCFAQIYMLLHLLLRVGKLFTVRFLSTAAFYRNCTIYYSRRTLGYGSIVLRVQIFLN